MKPIDSSPSTTAQAHPLPTDRDRPILRETPPRRVLHSFEPANAGWEPPRRICLGRSLSHHNRDHGSHLKRVGSKPVLPHHEHKAGRTITGFSFSFTKKKQPKNVTQKAKKAPSKPQPPKQEEQIDWMIADILDRFIGLSMTQQKTTLDKVEARLKGAKQARFKAAKSGSVKQLMTEFSLDINEAMVTL